MLLCISALVVLSILRETASASLKAGCKDNGEILPHPTDQCSYIVCSYAAPYNGRYGNNVAPVPRRCAPGTSVDTFEFDPYNPCSVTSDYCQPEFEIRYVGKVPYDLDKENLVTDKTNSYDKYHRQGQLNDRGTDNIIYNTNSDFRQGFYSSPDKGYVMEEFDQGEGHHSSDGESETEVIQGYSRSKSHQKGYGPSGTSKSKGETEGSYSDPRKSRRYENADVSGNGETQSKATYSHPGNRQHRYQNSDISNGGETGREIKYFYPNEHQNRYKEADESNAAAKKGELTYSHPQKDQNRFEQKDDLNKDTRGEFDHFFPSEDSRYKEADVLNRRTTKSEVTYSHPRKHQSRYEKAVSKGRKAESKVSYSQPEKSQNQYKSFWDKMDDSINKDDFFTSSHSNDDKDAKKFHTSHRNIEYGKETPRRGEYHDTNDYNDQTGDGRKWGSPEDYRENGDRFDHGSRDLNKYNRKQTSKEWEPQKTDSFDFDYTDHNDNYRKNKDKRHMHRHEKSARLQPEHIYKKHSFNHKEPGKYSFVKFSSLNPNHNQDRRQPEGYDRQKESPSTTFKEPDRTPKYSVTKYQTYNGF